MSLRRASVETSPAGAGSQHSSPRPASITELADRALDNLWDDSRDLKHYLRVAERYRREAKEALRSGDLETAFVFYAKAATLVLEKLPTHQDYHLLLNESQRKNLGLNGQDILDNLGLLKPILVTRFNDWRAAHPDAPLSQPDREQEQRQEQERIAAEEAALWRHQREGIQRQEEESRHRHSSRHSQQQHAQLDRRKDDPSSSARNLPAYHPPAQDYSFSRPENAHHGSQSTVVLMPDPDAFARQEKRRLEQVGIQRRQQEAEAEARQARQVIAVNNHPLGSLSATSSSSSVATTNDTSPMFLQTQPPSLTTTPASSFYQSSAPPSFMPEPLPGAPLRAPTAVHSRPQSQAFPFLDQYGNEYGPMPPGSNPADLYRTPTRATLRSTLPPPVTTTSPPPTDARLLFPQLMSPHQQRQGYYPSLNSMFVPFEQLSLNDRPNEGSNGASSTFVFASQEARKAAAATAAAEFAKSKHDGSGRWKPPSQLRSTAPPLPPPPPLPPLPLSRPPLANPSSSMPPLAPPLPPPPPPPPPPAIPTAGSRTQNHGADHHQHHRHGHSSQSTQAQVQPQPRSHSLSRSRSHPHRRAVPKLKTVTMPRECLPRFLAIAKVNTSMNRETCGLLLGREVFPGQESPPEYGRDSRSGKGKGGTERAVAAAGAAGGGGERKGEYIVTTLLIPKQHGTSDMCTMDEEELVSSFTDERSLITLGWIHTHPSQSCFMSSVDLHTHSAFQRMLPESFAVVCAPKSNPNFGIFQLTDPPGLQTILDCTEKEAFHPHPDVPIYTDADKGHVQMKDMPLEIIDLR